ncbi:hypothetical protein PV08_09419 [Exophiala spinifera]|uniref:Heterokaryon incompatibility domain-containing protein n=1 Tax=Exophiala spinifera TaxID=91928 RepID=A0A0D2BLT9_9EURO|nr:uncharacterized protein PV08_09419 [Exophiala spinifera]KIW12144.1 hypothetical protein PV08_09419 [Exophiala spinifera]
MPPTLALKPISSDRFRLLTANLNEKTGRLSFKTEVHSLAGNLVPPYVPISYTWFGPPTPDDTTVDSADGVIPQSFPDQVIVDDTSVDVTRNLANALRRVVQREWPLRAKQLGLKRRLRLWCDYLCIDQTNSTEKGEQVQNMTKIFGSASKVVAWLGTPPDDEEASCAMQLLSRLTATYKENVASGKGWAADIYKKHHDIWPSHSDWSLKAWRGLEALFKARYWSRGWMLQEITAENGTTFLWGDHHFGTDEFSMVVTMITELQNFPQFTDIIQIDRFCVGNIYLLMTRRKGPDQEESFELLRLLSLLRSAECTDARDKVYAISGLAKDVEIIPRYDRYNESGVDLFLNTAVSIIDVMHVQEALSYVFVPYTEQQRRICQPPIPSSWVPDWRLRTHCQKFTGGDFYTAGGPRWSCKASVAGDELQILGFRLDTVASLSVTYETEDPTYSVIQQWREILPRNGVYKLTGEEMESVFVTTVVADCILTNSVSSRGARADFEFLERARETMDPDMTSQRARMQAALGICLGRRLCVTRAGMVALVPAATEIGDSVCVLQGCGRCHVLRLEPDGVKGSYVGETYCHGMMDGKGTAQAYAESRKPVSFRLS